MDQFSENENEQTMRELKKAQLTLEQVQSKMKKFKSRKKQQKRQKQSKAPYPDLNQYFTFLSNQLQNQYMDPDIPYNHSQWDKRKLSLSSSSKANDPQNRGKQNNALSINKKLQQQKQSSITKIQEYYNQRNDILEQKYQELKETKEKIIRDQKLLIRNNQELQQEIDTKRQQRTQSKNINVLRNKIERMKNGISDIQLDTSNLVSRKREMQKQINQAIKTHKHYLNHQIILMQPKSASTKCKYH